MKPLKPFMTVSICALSTALAAPALAGGSNAGAAHDKFMKAFNARQWEEVRSLIAADGTFHRANAEEVYVGPDAIVERFESTIGAPDQWNVKFARLDSSQWVTGKDRRMVERGDFAVTAGADDGGCYVGSYMMTWVPEEGDGWKLQALAWQDVEADSEGCM